MIRGPTPRDQGYIAATWARSMLSTHAHQRHLSSRTGEQIGKQISAVLDRADSRALLYVRERDPEAILGWVLYVEGPSTPMVHFLYVRSKDSNGIPLRGNGIAGKLLSRVGVKRDAGVVCTSHGPSSESMRGLYRASVHVPLAEFLSPTEKR